MKAHCLQIQTYKYTDKILPIIAIACIIMIPILIWSVWQVLDMALYGKAYAFVRTLFVHVLAIEILIFGLSALAFFKRWRWILLFYIPYSAYMLPQLIMNIIDYFKHQQFHSAFYFPAKLHEWAYAILLIVICLTCILFLFEAYQGKKRGCKNLDLIENR